MDLSSRCRAGPRPPDGWRFGVAFWRPAHDHVGIFHGKPDKRQHMLHLEGHHKLSNEQLDTTVKAWVLPPIHDRRVRPATAMCRLVWRRNKDSQIPFAFSEPAGAIDRQGRLVLGGTRHGLTCASFVLAVFEAAQLPLVRYDEWKPREEDVPAQEELVEILEGQHDVDPEHVEAVRAEVGSVRYRREEVAGAAGAAEIPAGFQEAVDAGRHIAELV